MENIGALLDQLRTGYIGELPERFSSIEQLIIGLKTSDAVADTMALLYRETHSLKGSAGTYGCPIITTICHQLEDLLTTIGGEGFKPDESTIDNLLRYIDLFHQALSIITSDNEDFHAITETLIEIKQSGLAQKQCLLIEPSRPITLMITRALEELHYRVIHLDDGYLALDRLLDEPFDLIITSREIKRVNGRALIAAVKLSNGPNHSTPTMVLTSSNDLQNTRDTDADYIIVKDGRLIDHLTEVVSRLSRRVA
ncbi:hybrid sensor histidine kinase/response regulator [Candidatus Reidiella endopervernicosa]|nr:response regulator [Candidatus Reidiella endopervernicosa]QKQ25334.1 Hpt domain-containing protein [Candidatus Reidiella endopervernicosa]